MRLHTSPFALAILGLGLAATASFAASSAPRTVALLGVSGPGGGELAEALEQSLGDVYEVLPGEVYRAGAERLGHAGPTPLEVKYMCRRLRIDALVAGAVSARGLVLVVRDGATGEVSARGVYPLDDKRPIALRDRVLSDLVRAIERVRGVPHRGGSPVPIARPQAPVELPAPAAGEEEEAAPLAPPATEVVVRPLPPVEETAAVPALELAVGVSVFSRRLGFDQAGASGYSAGAIPAVAVEGRLFPFALAADYAHDHPRLAALGLYGGLERAPSFSSTSAAGAQTGGDAQRWRLGLLGRIWLGRPRALRGALHLFGGIDDLRFAHVSSATAGVPDVGYVLLGGGLGIEQPLATRRVTGSLRAGFAGTVDTSGLTADEEYGPGRGWAVDAEAGLLVRPLGWLFFRATARYTRIALSLDGAGRRYAHAAVDQWISGAFEIGGAL